MRGFKITNANYKYRSDILIDEIKSVGIKSDFKNIELLDNEFKKPPLEFLYLKMTILNLDRMVKGFPRGYILFNMITENNKGEVEVLWFHKKWLLSQEELGELV